MRRADDRLIHVDIATQQLSLLVGGRCARRWSVSTARNGPGERPDSGCTPRGAFRVRIKIGEGCPRDTVFVGRRPTGEIYRAELAEREPDRDWILSRIIWLGGLQSGHNRGPGCDTLRRFIYIHGCPDVVPMGVPLSHGCIRMRNDDVIALFDEVDDATRVIISGIYPERNASAA